MSPFKHTAFAMAAVLLCGSYALAYDQTEPETTVTEKPKYKISIGTEILDGDTTYQIGYPVIYSDGSRADGYFPFSELSFPLDAVMARIGTEIDINKDWGLNFTLKKNVTEPDEDMVDKDWITTSNPSRLDIYSESSISSFSSLIFDLNVEWDFFDGQNYSFFTGVGYTYERFDYTTNLLYQLSPSGLTGYDVTYNGTIPSIEYDATYHIPYLLLGTDMNIGDKFSFKGVFKASPYAMLFDKDVHLLREYGGKISESDMTGISLGLELAAKYHITEYAWIALGFNVLHIEVEGEQDQKYRAGFVLGEVAAESESTQYSGYLNIGMNF